MPTFATDDGARLHYRDEGAGRPVLLLHGCWMSGRFFDPLAERLVRGFRVVRPDFRAHGASQPVLHGHTVTRYAADVAALVERLDLTDAIVVGWSMGAFVEWELALSATGARFAAGVVVDQPASDFRTPDWPLAFADLDTLAALSRDVQEDWPGVVAGLVPQLFATVPGERELAWMRAELERIPPAIAASILVDQTLRDYRPRLAEIALPTLVCFGADEQIMPVALGRHLAEALPHGRLEVFDASGHCPFAEEPDRFAATLVAFAASADSAGASPAHPQRSQ